MLTFTRHQVHFGCSSRLSVSANLPLPTRASTRSDHTLSRVVFAAGILVGIAAFKDDWSTQASKADNFLGGTWARRRYRTCTHSTDHSQALLECTTQFPRRTVRHPNQS